MMSALLCQFGDAANSYDDAVRVPYLEYEGIKDEMRCCTNANHANGMENEKAD